MKRLHNVRQEVFCQNVANKKLSATKSYQSAYPTASKATAEVNAYNLLKTGKIEKRISELLDEQGLSITSLNTKLYDLTEADKEIIYKGRVRTLKDNPTRLEAIKTSYKLHKVLDNDTPSQDNRQVNVTLNSVEAAHIIDKLQDLNAKLLSDGLIQDGEIC